MQNSSAKRSIPVILIILLFIPLIVAIVSGIGVDPYTPSVNSLTAVSVQTADNTYEFTDKEALALYSDITSGAKEVDKAILGTIGFEDETPYKVIYTESTGEPVQFGLYLSKNADDCVYVTPEEKYFLISSDIAQRLIVREEFASIDTSAVLPNLTAQGYGDEEKISVNTYEWTYTALDGNVLTLKNTKESKNPIVKFNDKENGQIKLSFDKIPDIFGIKITDADGTVEFDGTYAELPDANIIYNSDEKFTMTVNAEWIEKDSSSYHGTATYVFEILYDILPTYKVVNGPLPVGDFTILRMSDFNDGEQLYVESEIGLPEKMNVYDIPEEENVKIAIIPYGAHLNWGTSYTLTLKTEAGQTDTVTVGTRAKRNGEGFKPTQSIIIDSISSPDLEGALSKESLEEFDALVADLTENSANEKMFDGKFLYPTGSSKVVSGGAEYGMKREFPVSDFSYTCFGNDLEAMDGQEIKAANSGKVVFAATTTLLGNTVVIDHGFGALSYYGNLSEISVSIGDSVEKSQGIGKAGSTGFACVFDSISGKQSTLCHYAVSMNGIFVSPASASYGISYGR